MLPEKHSFDEMPDRSGLASQQYQMLAVHSYPYLACPSWNALEMLKVGKYQNTS
ncbi:hypothetical protein CORMATOL_00598 [Corynebacterium matruchotii ATCC 33806]|uniref:Uncharacterized protein n=1 Tax=Corynebacterium matruchotii ATCC 33806 TaxID=566549 RepID=C0E0U9_9CORY|nr:hypothetical protein CORMATOL_00598 [Corynebacterium matruchotii ATCC 33806]